MFRKPKWEYTQMVVSLKSAGSMLSDIGKDGWEAYAVVNDPRPHNALLHDDYNLVVMFKRKV